MRHLVAAGNEVHLVLAFGGGVLLPLGPPGVKIFELSASRLAVSGVELICYLKAERRWSLQAIM